MHFKYMYTTVFFQIKTVDYLGVIRIYLSRYKSKILMVPIIVMHKLSIIIRKKDTL